MKNIATVFFLIVIASHVVAEPRNARSRIEFDRDLSIEAARMEVAEANVAIVSLRSEFQAGLERIQDEYFLMGNEDSDAEIADAIAEARRLLLVDLLTGMPSEATGLEDLEIRAAALRDFLRGDTDALRRVAVTGVTIAVEAQNRGIATAMWPGMFSPVPVTCIKVAPPHFPGWSWWPNSGTSHVGVTSLKPVEKRHSLQYFKWDAPIFNLGHAYEHDVFLDNRDRKTYLSSATTPGTCAPIVDYAATSWPKEARPYLDTRFHYPGDNTGWNFCQQDDISFTWGISDAWMIRPHETHFTYIRTTAGKATTDKFMVQAQVLTRCPGSSGTWSTWPVATRTLLGPKAVIPGSAVWIDPLPKR